MQVIGKSKIRVDAIDKVTGQAKYTEDILLPNLLVTKIIRSTIASGMVKSFDLEEAKKVKGVVEIFTCFDVPDILYPTAGHPWSVEENHQDIKDKKLLSERVSYYGNEIAVVVAKDYKSAERAARLVKVEYEEWEAYLDIDSSLKAGARAIHSEVRKNNIIADTEYKLGEKNFEELSKNKDLVYFEDDYETSVVQHCHMELVVSRAYMENGKITCISSTQIPHIMRRVIGQALGIPWGKVRVIKPYIGGGFGNKQDVLYEPLNCWLTMKLGGRPVEVRIPREDVFQSTRTRHKINANVKMYAKKDGEIVGRKYLSKANNGGYASHGHAVMANCANLYRVLYKSGEALESRAITAYTNLVPAGAMRAYGIPQGDFILECSMDDLALKLDIDPIEIRLKNMMEEGFEDPLTAISDHSYGLKECIEAGKKYIDWDEKREKYRKENFNKDRRRGVGMAIFCYKTGVYPISLETASCRISLNQDGSIQLQVGATEIGQGSDTIFSMMAAETIGISLENVHIVSFQDTDVTLYDSGAYASRQSYVSGGAVKKTSESFKKKILKRAEEILKITYENLDIKDDNIIEKNTSKKLISMEDFAMEALYSLEKSEHIQAAETYHCKNNTYSFGATFADIEVDMNLGKIEIKDIVNCHDSGKILNPATARGQVHGGMSMSLGYTFGENYIFSEKGKLLNGNLLDYKMPTAMDHPDLNVIFVETYDKTGPYGNKSLGEPPAISPAPAIRNALLHATGVKINTLPLNPEKLIKEFQKEGLIK